jgi:hypothetical protein
MPAIRRLSDTPYRWDIIEAPLSEVANLSTSPSARRLHPKIGALRYRDARIRVDDGQAVAIERYEYIEMRSCLYCVGPGTICVESISYRDGRWHVLVYAIDDECHNVCSCAVSIENMISSAITYRRLY